MDEVWAGESLLAFDGRVLEVFGFPGAVSMRFHVRNLRLSVSGPDGGGTHWVLVQASHGSGGCNLQVAADQWPGVGPFLERVFAAMPSPAG